MPGCLLGVLYTEFLCENHLVDPCVLSLEERQGPILLVEERVCVGFPVDRASRRSACETPRSKVAIDLRPCHAFCGPIAIGRSATDYDCLLRFFTASYPPSPLQE